jgi:hypothetical protein
MKFSFRERKKEVDLTKWPEFTETKTESSEYAEVLLKEGAIIDFIEFENDGKFYRIKCVSEWIQIYPSNMTQPQVESIHSWKKGPWPGYLLEEPKSRPIF